MNLWGRGNSSQVVSRKITGVENIGDLPDRGTGRGKSARGRSQLTTSLTIPLADSLLHTVGRSEEDPPKSPPSALLSMPLLLGSDCRESTSDVRLVEVLVTSEERTLKGMSPS